jgi:predicted nucleotidyltransferase
MPFTMAAVNEPAESQPADLVKRVLDAKFPLSAASLIHLFVGGSQLHGAKVSGYDDLDIYGCYIEPPERILGVLALEHFVWSSGSETEKNTADDVDVTTYSLHRWGERIRKGNPAILHYLFAANALSSDTWERFIGSHRDNLISKTAARQYLGFAASQRMRLTGERGMGRHGQRPDLIERYGFDVKFAMHYVRLLGECRELLREHKVTLPRGIKISDPLSRGRPRRPPAIRDFPRLSRVNFHDADCRSCSEFSLIEIIGKPGAVR